MIHSPENVTREAIWILPFSPDWSAGVETRFTLPADGERGLTGRESRRAYADTLRLEMEFESLLSAAEASTLRNALQAAWFEDLPVWFPFWPADRDDDEQPSVAYASAFRMNWNNSHDARIVWSGSGSSWWKKQLPALRGYFSAPPQVEAITDELFVARFRIKESGSPDYALRITGVNNRYGPQISGRDYPMAPFQPQWRSSVETGSASVEIERRDMGFNRQEVRVVYPQSPERGLKFQLSLYDNAAAAQLIHFFATVQANVRPFWCPTWLAETRLQTSVNAGATTLPVTGGNDLGENAYLALVEQNGQTEVRRIVSKTDISVALADPIAFGYGAQTTSLSTAALFRFVKTVLTLRWSSPDEVEASVDLKEAPSEYYTPQGETHGDTIGTLHRSCFLYRFTVEYPGTSQVWRFTSYEDPLSDASGTYTPQSIEHGEIRETLNLERNEVQLRTRAFDGNPLLSFIPFRLEFPLKLEVIEAKIWPGGTTIYDWRRLFSGEVTRVQMDGPYITAKAVQVGNLFERKIPRLLLQPTCNYALFDGACGLSKDNWKYRGYVLNTLTNPPRICLRGLFRQPPGTWVQPDLHWFAGGWIELGSGTDFESRFIADATAYDSTGDGFIELTLSTPLGRIPAVDEEVFLFPGCDGKRGTCKEKFANYSRFGGFPHMPVGNPSMVKMPANRNMK